MTYNEEMASILISNNLATEANIRALWHNVNEENTIGAVLVQNNLLASEIYQQLTNFMKEQQTSYHPPQPPQANTSTIDIVPADPSSESLEVDAHSVQPATTNTQVDAYATPQSAGPKNPLPPKEPETPQQESSPRPVQSDNSKAHQTTKETLPLNFMQPKGSGKLEEAIPTEINKNSTLNQIFLYARSVNATDIHITCDTPITFRIAGNLTTVSAQPFSASDVERVIRQALRSDQLFELEESGDLEFVYTIQGAGRFRSTALKYRKGLSLTARLIPMKFRSVTDIGLPESCLDLTKWAQGMILVTGPAGCGKSTTLSSLIEYINETRNEHIITIENPIENIYPKAKSQVVQREVGLHTLSQNNALRGALRQDPDILVISELRDLESIQLAVSAAETGHLVFGTMNTTDAIRTIDRLIGSFPSDEQPIIRSMVSESLRGVISQRLLPSVDGKSVIPAFEVLKVTSPVSNMIRKNETHQLKSTMITGRKDGMVVFDDSLEELVKAGKITKETAQLYTDDKTRFA